MPFGYTNANPGPAKKGRLRGPYGPLALRGGAILLVATLIGTLLAVHVLAASRQAPHAARKGKPPAPEPAREIAMPFAAGEKLEYQIGWAAFSNAATLELGIPERRELFGWTTWHFRAAFHTLRPVRNLFVIDDQFDSYTDTSSLESRQFESYLNEMGKAENNVVRMIPKGQQPRAPAPAVIVPPRTRDPLGMLFTLRGVDWQRTPEVRLPVYDGHNLYEMRAQTEAAADHVQVAAGSFVATRIAIRLFQNEKESAGIHFTLWLANDSVRTPVQIAAQLPFGSLHVGLASRAAAKTP